MSFRPSTPGNPARKVLFQLNVKVTLDANSVGTLELPTAGFDLIYLSALGTDLVSISSLTLKPGTPTAKTTYGYNPLGQLTNAQFPNGTSRTVTYDRAGRISTLAVDPLAAWTYTRDANGNPTRIDAQGIGLYGNRTFTYDSANRLTGACFVATTPCPSVSTQAWTYDAVGRRLTQNDAGVTSTYTYDVADQMLTSKLGSVTTGYTYDGKGNQLTGGTRVSTYNTAKQTVSIKDGAAPATIYAYDGKGNRVTSTNNAVVSRYSLPRDLKIEQ